MPYYDLRDLSKERINIEPKGNICHICEKPCTYFRHFFHQKVLDDDLIREVNIITAHPACKNLVNKIKKLKDEKQKIEDQLFELEFKLIKKK